MDTTNIIKLETNTYYDKQRKKFFFVTNLLDTLPPELFTMTKNEDGYYTKTGKIWKYYYKNPRCFPTKEQVYLLPFINRLKGRYWSNWKFRENSKWMNSLKTNLHRSYNTQMKKDAIRMDAIHFNLNVIYDADEDGYFSSYLEYQLCVIRGWIEQHNPHINGYLLVKSDWRLLCRGNGIKGYSNLKKKQLIKAYMLADEPLRVSRKNNRIYFESGRSIPLDTGDLT